MARAAATIQAELSSAYTARANILSGGAIDSYMIGGKSFRFNLGELNRLIKDLEDELAEAQGSSSVILADLRGAR